MSLWWLQQVQNSAPRFQTGPRLGRAESAATDCHEHSPLSLSGSVMLLVVSKARRLREGFPDGAVVENLPANAGDTGSSPGLGGSHMPWSNWAREPQLLSLRVWSLCSAAREAAIVRGPHAAMKSGPLLPQLEKALTQKRRPNTFKNLKKEG